MIRSTKKLENKISKLLQKYKLNNSHSLHFDQEKDQIVVDVRIKSVGTQPITFATTLRKTYKDYKIMVDFDDSTNSVVFIHDYDDSIHTTGGTKNSKSRD